MAERLPTLWGKGKFGIGRCETKLNLSTGTVVLIDRMIVTDGAQVDLYRSYL